MFLKEKAILFEKLGKSRTFLIYNEEKLDIELEILAYYTIALQVLKIPENLSNQRIKKLDGLSAKIRGERILEFPVILIGQLGKNELYENAISGSEVMNYCLSTILDGQIRLGGRIIMLECKNVPYLISFYEGFGFSKIDKDYEDDEFLQFIKILNEDEIVEL